MVANESFTVMQDLDITVHFIKKDDEEAPPATNCFMGSKQYSLSDEVDVTVDIYAELSSSSDIVSPYGDATYGYIVTMFDPTQRYITEELSTYIFSAPLKVHSYQYDEQNDRRWLVVDGGSFTFGNLKLLPNGGNAFDAMIISMMFAFDGFSSPSITPRHYRIEMLDYDEATGEFTCGKLQTFSPKYGWLWGGDERLRETTKGVFVTMYDQGLPDTLFEGARMKTAPKRNDVWWYPPLVWYNGEQSALDNAVELMGKSYRGFTSEYDKLFPPER